MLLFTSRIAGYVFLSTSSKAEIERMDGFTKWVLLLSFFDKTK